MNEMPTSGPISASISHQARDASNSRQSFTRSQTTALRERKHRLLEIGCGRPDVAGLRAELVTRAVAADPAAAEQHEAIAHAGGIADLMNREEERAAGGRMAPQGVADLPGLPKIEPIERLVHEQQRLRRDPSDGEHGSLPLSLRERAHANAQQRFELQLLDDLVAAAGRRPEIAVAEVE